MGVDNFDGCYKSLFGYFLAIQKVTPRRAGGQGIYIFSYARPKKGHQNHQPVPHNETEQQNNKQNAPIQRPKQ